MAIYQAAVLDVCGWDAHSVHVCANQSGALLNSSSSSALCLYVFYSLPGLRTVNVQSKWSSSLRLLILCVILAYPFLGIGQGWAHINITYAVPKLSVRLDSSQQQVVCSSTYQWPISAQQDSSQHIRKGPSWLSSWFLLWEIGRCPSKMGSS